MAYIIILVITSLLGMFGFIYATFKKDKIPTNQFKLRTANILNRSKVNNSPPISPPKSPVLPFPFAIFGVLFSLFASLFGLTLFLKRNKQFQRQKGIFSQNIRTRRFPYFLNKDPQKQKYDSFLKKR